MLKKAFYLNFFIFLFLPLSVNAQVNEKLSDNCIGKNLRIYDNGKNFSDEKVIAHVHESPNVMILPLIILAFFSIFSGFFFSDFFFGIKSTQFWGDSLINIATTEKLTQLNEIPLLIKKIPTIMMISGIITAVVLFKYLKFIKDFFKNKFYFIFKFLKNKWFIDELYNFIFVSPIRFIGKGLWRSIDQEFIDNIGPNGISKIINKLGVYVSSLQSGYLYHYALTIIIGLTIFISIYFNRVEP